MEEVVNVFEVMDDIKGEDGNDELYGGTEDDNASIPQQGGDKIFGGDGRDFIDGRWGTDSINGGAKADTIYGGWNEDSIQGGGGNDLIYGDHNEEDEDYENGQNDTIDGGSGTDTIYGGGGDDHLSTGTGGRESVYGGTGNDTLIAGGDDELFGGAGEDTLKSKKNTSWTDFEGGADNDIFEFRWNQGTVFVKDYEAGDKLRFKDGAGRFNDIGPMDELAVEDTGNVIITWARGEVFISNATIDMLTFI